jgi:signal transduction histidine kinase
MEEEDLEALRLFAGYAGFAIENSRLKEAILKELDEQKLLEENEQRRRMILEKVVRLGKQVTEVSDLRTTLKKIWHGVREELDFDRVGLFTYNPQANNMVGAYGTNREGNIWDAWHVTFELDENSLFYKVLIHPNGFYFTKDYEKEFNLPPDHEMVGVKHAALVAVWSGNKPTALISVDQLITGRPILDEQLEALRLFAGYAGLAISNSHLNDALQEELSQRQKFIDELEAKNAELERFTYTASHDLKSPLVTITGFLGYLEKDALAGNQERMKNSITRINTAAEKMQALLNDLLELSRIGRLMNPPEDISFTEIVNEAVDRVRGRLDEVNAIVEIQTDFPIVNGDRVRLVEVVQNLIENAVKYATPDTNPRIEIGSDNVSKNGMTTFHVRDNGIGIAPEYHERIFGLFNKLDPHSEGTGIGLSLVKRIIEVHNGHVWVESEKSKGATFYFSLPTSQTKE